MGTPISFTKALTAASATGIAASQTPGAAGDLTLTASPVVLDTARQVILTFAADETGHIFTVYGNTRPDGTGNAISETIAGTSAGVVTSARMYGQVTRIAISAAATGAVEAGTNGVGASPWISSNYHVTPSNWSIACAVTATVNFTVQVTYDDFWTVQPGSTQGNEPTAWDVTALASKAANTAATITDVITGWRLKINSGTGSVAVSAVQADISGA